MIELLGRPWPWYASGPLLGLMVPLLLFVGNKHFGVSSTFRDICAAALPARAAYFRYRWQENAWRLFLVGGVVIGAALAALFLDGTQTPALSSGATTLFAEWGLADPSGLLPGALYDLRELGSARSLIALGFGGFLVGFGTRYADGCTSGHAIMGLSLLNLGSLVAVLGFFAGGLLVSHLILPAVLAL